MTVGALAVVDAPVPADPQPYTYYTTDWQTGQIREELPLSGVVFSLPLSGHGDLRGTYTVPHGQAALRAATAPVVSGVLVCRGGRPVWEGMLWADQQVGRRSFTIAASEWGSVFERAVVSKAFAAAQGGDSLIYTGVNDHTIFADLIARAQEYAGQNYNITVPATTGPSTSDLTVPWWETATIEELFTELGNREGGPEWAFTVTGSSPQDVQRRLLLGTPLGRASVAESTLLLEYVENTGPAPAPPEGPPVVTTLENLFPGLTGDAVLRGPHGQGGNVIAVPGLERDGGNSATEVVVTGEGQGADMLHASATATDLLALGWPRLTRTAAYSSVARQATLNRHAAADLAAGRGLTVVVRCSTFGFDPDWTQVQRGDAVRVELDTDLHGPRPYTITSRVLGMDVKPSQDGGHEEVTYTVASVQS